MGVHRFLKADENRKGAHGGDVACCVLAHKCDYVYSTRQPNIGVLRATPTNCGRVPHQNSSTVDAFLRKGIVKPDLDSLNMK